MQQSVASSQFESRYSYILGENRAGIRRASCRKLIRGRRWTGLGRAPKYWPIQTSNVRFYWNWEIRMSNYKCLDFLSEIDPKLLPLFSGSLFFFGDRLGALGGVDHIWAHNRFPGHCITSLYFLGLPLSCLLHFSSFSIWCYKLCILLSAGCALLRTLRQSFSTEPLNVSSLPKLPSFISVSRHGTTIDGFVHSNWTRVSKLIGACSRAALPGWLQWKLTSPWPSDRS